MNRMFFKVKKLNGVLAAVTIMMSLICGCAHSEQSVNNSIYKSTLPSTSEKVLNHEPDAGTQNVTPSPVYNYRNGNQYLKKYQGDQSVKQIVLVEQSVAETSVGTLYLLTKNNQGCWDEQFNCEALLGKNGLDKKIEGDGRTPSGDYRLTLAFGINDNPGALKEYTKVTQDMYLCGDREYYNQFIDVSKTNHRCSSASEHIIDYVPQYNYALNLDYNKECIYGNGSAIFLHCKGNYRYTLGCIAIDEDKMKIILQTVDNNAHICIYSYRKQDSV